LYRIEHGTDSGQIEPFLKDYFRLNFSLKDLYCDWSKRDPQFSKLAKPLQGIRLLRQDPTEAFFSFICSSNNNIGRITKMVHSLRRTYGSELGLVGESEMFSFPEIHVLADLQESELRDLGLGYRARYVVDSAKMLLKEAEEKGIPKDQAWIVLDNLRNVQDRSEVMEFLIQFPGVGRKVADCIALFALDRLDCIPVDTHVWAIAKKFYKSQMKQSKNLSSLTDKVYADIGDTLRNVFGPQAGWAHSVLFTADLRSFQHKLLKQKESLEEEVEESTSVIKEEKIAVKSEIINFGQSKPKRRRLR
jgi:N-glycosylase/DNA lyase